MRKVAWVNFAEIGFDCIHPLLDIPVLRLIFNDRSSSNRTSAGKQQVTSIQIGAVIYKREGFFVHSIRFIQKCHFAILNLPDGDVVAIRIGCI